MGRRPGGRRGTTVATVASAALITVFASTFLVAVVGLLVVVGTYNQYAADLPSVEQALSGLRFEQQTIVYDRTGKVELARLGDLKRELVEFDEIPGEVLDATTAIEDKDFWINAGFDPFAIISAGVDTVTGRPRGASTITQQLVRQRLLRPSDFEGSTYDRKIREIIQSIKLTEAFPGQEGKEQIITAYLNQNFYGNQSYGIKAAAKSYFGKELAELSLAQAAILAAIPQSPTRFDLIRNADSVCLEDVPEGAECTKFQLVVPPDTEVVQRRDYILELMKTRSPLTGDQHTAAEYEAAKDEPVELVRQVSVNWKAPHFVWQVRHQLGQIFCPDDPDDCPEVDSGGYRVTTSLDWEMQKIAEKWVYVAARAPNAKDPRAVLAAKKIPESEHSWILGLRGHDIHNAAAAVQDYRTGEILAYVGSASYTSRGNATFQPQFDVLADGWRQPGSAIKPVNYLIGIDDKAITASTMLMDVVTDFGNDYTPTQADKLERGPVRVRSALQFSLNIPAIKGTILTGLDRVFERTKDFGLTYPSTAIPVVSMGIGTLELHPIDLLGAYSTIADGGVHVPRKLIELDRRRQRHEGLAGQRPGPEGDPRGERRGGLHRHGHPGREHRHQGQPVLGQVGDLRRRHPAPRGVQDRDHERQPRRGRVRLPRPAAGRHHAGAGGRGLDGQQRQQPQRRQAVARYLRAALVGDPDRDQQGPARSPTSSPPEGLETAEVDAFTGLKPGPFTDVRRSRSSSCRARCRRRRRRAGPPCSIDEASGLLWQEGCAGPQVTRGFFDLSRGRGELPENWQKANADWGARAARGSGVRGGPEGTRTSYFYNNSFAPFGRTWGASFAPTALCPIVPVICEPFFPDPLNLFPIRSTCSRTRWPRRTPTASRRPPNRRPATETRPAAETATLPAAASRATRSRPNRPEPSPVPGAPGGRPG